MVVLDLTSNLTTTGSSCSPVHPGLHRGCGGPHPVAGVPSTAEPHPSLCERGGVWHIQVAGDCDLGQLYVFSVYFLSSQEYGKGWDSKELLLGHQGSLTPLPSAAQCVVWVWSSTTYLAANHITGSLSLVMRWHWIKLHMHWSVQKEVQPVLVCIWALKMNVYTEDWLKIIIWNWKGLTRSNKMPWSATWSWLVRAVLRTEGWH